MRHPKGECVVPGLVVVKIIYTREEACRRKEEDKEVSEAFRKTNKQVGLADESRRISKRREGCAGGKEKGRAAATPTASIVFSVRAHQLHGAPSVLAVTRAPVWKILTNYGYCTFDALSFDGCQRAHLYLWVDN